MRKIGKTLAALTLATSALALGVVGGTPAMAGSDGVKYDIVLIELSGIEVPVYVNISPELTANLCGVDISLITALTHDSDRANCPNQGRTAKAKKH
jgi:hypothetical protein